MANLLTITKKSFGYYDFVVNGDTANIVTNDRNDMTGVGIYCHFKFANGANLIKQQNVTFGNVTLIDGVALPAPVSMDDLISKLDSIDFFAWRDATGGGGVDRFDELEDTFSYFGKDGQILRVNESELKLETFEMPDVDYLYNFPTPLVANKILKVNGSGTAYILVDPPAGSAGLNQEFEYVSGDPEFTLGTSSGLSAVFWNSALLRKADWSQVGNTLTIGFALTAGDIIQPIGII